jgi:plasmid stabilization system protein ParE
MNYRINLPRQVVRDVQEALFYQEQLGTYPQNIDSFSVEIDNLIWEKLVQSPKTGANLSARVPIETDIKYMVVQNYLLFYEIVANDQVDVLRLLPARSDWMTTLLG